MWCANYCQIEPRLGQIKDPIQRAGVRLLWAAAIPIQTQARRFMARQAAIKRMCAVLTIQAVSAYSTYRIFHRNIDNKFMLTPHYCLVISLSADGSPSATLRLLSGQPPKSKRRSGVGSHVIRLQITTIAQLKFKELLEDILQRCMSSKICIA